MIGDKINIKPQYMTTAQRILTLAQKHVLDFTQLNKAVVLIGGESGSGKSVTATCIAALLDEQGIRTAILHQDDYFKLPPYTNHSNRLDSLQNVGLHEVRMGLLQNHIDLFLDNAIELEKPLVHYANNSIQEETINLQHTKVLIIEGTYTLALEHSHLNIFIDRNYIQTEKNRMDRAREESSGFLESVLKIEHNIIMAHKSHAHIIMNNDYDVYHLAQ